MEEEVKYIFSKSYLTRIFTYMGHADYMASLSTLHSIDAAIFAVIASVILQCLFKNMSLWMFVICSTIVLILQAIRVHLFHNNIYFMCITY